MKLEILPLGQLETNAHVLWDEATAQALVFDCPDSPGPLLSFLRGKNLVLTQLFLTHAHADHMAGLDEVVGVHPQALVYQHQAEAQWLSDPQLNLSAWMGSSVTSQVRASYLTDGQKVPTAVGEMEVFHVPGHSPGSLFYYFEKEALALGGDLLFRGSVGRWDFPGSDERQLKKSLARVCGLPHETRVYPGHGPSTTIGREKADNPYLRQ